MSSMTAISPSCPDYGVSDDGRVFLSDQGLSKLCSVPKERFRSFGHDYVSGSETKNQFYHKINNLLNRTYPNAQNQVHFVEGSSGYYVFYDMICLVFLEYFSFEENNNPTALKVYRSLVKNGFKSIVMYFDGFHVDPWTFFHTRVSYNKNLVPEGYFILFHELAEHVVTLIKNNKVVNENSIDDERIEQDWEDYWHANELNKKYGLPIDFSFNYPSSFQKSIHNPYPVNAYPNEALAEFRKWLLKIG